MALLDIASFAPQDQQQASMRGLIGTMLGIGAASGPSPVPVSPLAAISRGGIAGIQAYDDAQSQNLRRGLIGAQISKLLSDEQKRKQAQQFVQAMSMGYVNDTPANRALATSFDLDTSKFWGGVGERPYDVQTGPNGLQLAPGAASVLGQRTFATEAPKTALDIFGSFSRYQPPIPYTAGGGIRQFGASPDTAQDAVRQLLPGGLLGGGGNTQLRGGAGDDTLTDTVTSTVTGSTPMTPQGFDLKIPKQQDRVFQAPGVPPANVYGVESKPRESFGDEKGKVYGKAFADIREGAARASAMETNISFMRGLDVSGGALTPFLAGLGGLAEAVGVSPARVAKLTGVNVADAQAFDAASKELVFSMIGSLGTGVSNADRQFIEAIVPQLRNTPGATEKLFDYLQAKIDFSKDRWQNAFDADMRGGSKDVYAPLRADSDWKKANKFEDWLKRYPSFQPAPVPTAKPDRPEVAEPTAGVQPIPRTPDGGIDTLLLKNNELRRLPDGRIGRFNRQRGGFEIVEP
jgi:hypothetical protein